MKCCVFMVWKKVRLGKRVRQNGCLIASFYLVDRGLWHRLPGISGFGPACCSSVTGPRRFRCRWAHYGRLPMGGAQVCGGWFDRNSPHRARGLLRDRKLEEPPRNFPTGLGIDSRDLSAAHHFLQVSRRILHHRCVAFVLPTPS